MPKPAPQNQKIAIIGTGLIGRAWAISFARAGFSVSMWDPEPTHAGAARGFIEGIAQELVTNGLSNGQTLAQLLDHISIAATLEEALADVDYVQENTPEVLDTKIEVFRRLDALAHPAAILASSTSALLPSRFTEGLAGRGRCIVAHPINPPYLVPAAEVVPAPWTTETTIAATRDILLAAGHVPLVMKKELDGFIMNRLQGALLEEAFRLVADGYATAEDVDAGIRDGLALRWSFMGPFETIDLNAPGGIRDYAQRYQGIYANIFAQTQRRVDWAGDVMNDIEGDRRKSLPAGKLAERQMWRDRRLMALIAHKRRAAKDIGS